MFWYLIPAQTPPLLVVVVRLGVTSFGIYLLVTLTMPLVTKHGMSDMLMVLSC